MNPQETITEARRRYLLDAEFHAKVVVAVQHVEIEFDYGARRDLTEGEYCSAILSAAVVLLLSEGGWDA